MDQGKAAEAEPLADRITRDYPRDRENWLLAAQVKMTLKKFVEAAAAYERAGKLLRWGGDEDNAAAAAMPHMLDLRHNGGGSTAFYAEFLRTIIADSTSTGRQLYGLIGRRTYSAAGNLITELEQLANAVFVGEPSSECCTFYGSPSTFTLPYSKLRGRISTKKVEPQS